MRKRESHIKVWAASLLAGFVVVALVIWPRGKAAGRVERLRPIYFQFDSDLVTEDQTIRLTNEDAPAIRRTGQTVTLTGHTDASGTEAYNVGLSERRAVAVANVLVAAGVSGEQISVRGAGESEPAAVEVDEESAALNRRVTMDLV